MGSEVLIDRECLIAENETTDTRYELNILQLSKSELLINRDYDYSPIMELIEFSKIESISLCSEELPVATLFCIIITKDGTKSFQFFKPVIYDENRIDEITVQFVYDIGFHYSKTHNFANYIQIIQNYDISKEEMYLPIETDLLFVSSNQG